ncbi:MAG TPA: ATP-binding cassette domain-containing protein [Caulobacteraceae bacterium]|jgi:ATPase subunit of ABC transporter with duplicated ATPase domains|nr:ATP-binding cassette domain-containing protein [Caulobacteraceae bacterium]
MLPILTLERLSAATPEGRVLFDDLNLSLERGLNGLVGRNGSGKTTLLRIIAGEAAPSAGVVQRRGTLAILRQGLEPAAKATVADLAGVSKDLARLRRIEAGRGAPDDLDAADWLIEPRLAEALGQVGLAGLSLDSSAVRLSGGERTRAGLAGALALEPDLLLLDEPTNNLDAGARAFVAAALANFRGAALVASHDRALLRGMDQILELSPLGPRLYGGGWGLFVERREAEAQAARRALAEAQDEARQLQREAQASRERQARRDAGGKRVARSGSIPRIVAGGLARRAQVTAGRAERLAERRNDAAAGAIEAARARVERIETLAFALPASGLAAGRSVLVVEDAAFAFPGTASPLFGPVTFALTGPERMAVTGPNGSGKTSLLRLILGELDATQGRLRRGVSAASVDQQAAVLHEDESLLEAFRRLDPLASPHHARAALARFLFRGEAALRPVSSLSGGERLRAALACTLGATRPPQLLVLDEPTNHLDIASVEAVEQALAEYDGALVVVSHDEDFLTAVGVTRRLELRGSSEPNMAR